jgi:hypothetical protein
MGATGNRVTGVDLVRGFESPPLRSARRATANQQVYAATTLGGSAPLAQLDRASVYGTEGREFESLRARGPNL